MRKAAFLDRDGVINRDHGYVHRVADFEFLPKVPNAMQRLSHAGYRLVVVTNQSGIARGYFSENDYNTVSAHMLTQLGTFGVVVDGIYHCPHHPDGSRSDLRRVCDCRKPGPGLILKAAEDLQIDLEISILIGDKITDIAAGKAAGIGRCYLIGDEARAESSTAQAEPDAKFRDLSECVDFIVNADAQERSLSVFD